MERRDLVSWGTRQAIESSERQNDRAMILAQPQ